MAHVNGENGWEAHCRHQNQADKLKNCLKTAPKQAGSYSTADNFKNGPTSSTPKILNSFASICQMITRPTQPPTRNPATNANVGKKKHSTRGSALSKEDEMLKKVRVHVSEDTITGSDQKGKMFTEVINKFYKIMRSPCRAKQNDKSAKRCIR